MVRGGAGCGDEDRRTGRVQEDRGRKEWRDSSGREREACSEERSGSWMGVGQHCWRQVMDSKKPVVRVSGESRRLWLFGDSLLRGVGQEIHSLSKGGYRVVDRSRPGANVWQIRRIVRDHLEELMPGDLVMIEGGGNGLERVGGRETVNVMHQIVKLVREKVDRRPLVMGIPMRRGEEGASFGRERRWVNRKCVERLEDWQCDGLHLWERMDWRQVWARDGIHLSNVGKVWLAWNVVEWAQHWEDVGRA